MFDFIIYFSSVAPLQLIQKNKLFKIILLTYEITKK